MSGIQTGICESAPGSALLRQRLQGLSRAATGAPPTEDEMVRQVARLGAEPGGAAFTPGTVWALLDISASMGGAPLDQAKRGLEQFSAEAVRQGYHVGVIAFESSAHEVVQASDDLRSLTAGIRAMATGGSTAMAGAIRMATARLRKMSRDRIIFLVTDGQPDDRAATVSAAKAAHAAGIDLMTLGTETADYQFLQSIATRADLARQVPQVDLQAGIAQTARLLLRRHAAVETAVCR